MRNILMKKTMATSIRMGNTTSTSRMNTKLTPQGHSQPMTLFHRQENTTSTTMNTMRTSRRMNQAKMTGTSFHLEDQEQRQRPIRVVSGI